MGCREMGSREMGSRPREEPGASLGGPCALLWLHEVALRTAGCPRSPELKPRLASGGTAVAFGISDPNRCSP